MTLQVCPPPPPCKDLFVLINFKALGLGSEPLVLRFCRLWDGLGVRALGLSGCVSCGVEGFRVFAFGFGAKGCLGSYFVSPRQQCVRGHFQVVSYR